MAALPSQGTKSGRASRMVLKGKYGNSLSLLKEACMKVSKTCSSIAGILLLSAAALPPAWAQTTLQLINEYPATSITADADLRFAAQVEEQSGGDLKIETLQEK